MSQSDIAISIRDLSKSYVISHQANGAGLRNRRPSFRDVVTERLRNAFRTTLKETFWALKEVSFDVKKGEIVGIIGRNGAGKSTLLKILSRITKPTSGEIDVYGRIGSLLEVGTGFHAELTGRENIFLNGAILGMRRLEIRKQFDAIVDFAEVEQFLDTPVKRYSSGMYVRLAFAVAAHLNPEILIVDEVLAVGDASFQKKCLGKMEEAGARGRAVLFVSHSMPSVLRLCNRVIMLESGRIVTDGPPAEAARAYLGANTHHPAERRWQEPSGAPGDSIAALRAVRILNESGDVSDLINIAQECRIEIEYWNNFSTPRVTAAFHLISESGTIVFASADFINTEWHNTTRRRGIVRSSCCIPGSLLAEGRYSVLAALCSFDPNVVHAVERDAVTFQVVENNESGLMRKLYGGIWPGELRPTLPWRVSYDQKSA
jgi:lipopolysaccharide transport system ATP-binding protein